MLNENNKTTVHSDGSKRCILMTQPAEHCCALNQHNVLLLIWHAMLTPASWPRWQ